MNTNGKIHLALTVMASLVLSSCASTQLSHTWRDASYTAGPLKKILVVAERTNQQWRRTWEDGFAAALASHGVDVTPSYRLIAAALPDTGLVNTVARARNFDGILLVGRVSRTTTDRVTAGMDIASPEYLSHPWSGWNYTYFDRDDYPGYPVLDNVAKDEIRVWAVQGEGQMVWTGVCEVRERDGDEDVSGRIISVIVPQLLKQGVVGEGL